MLNTDKDKIIERIQHMQELSRSLFEESMRLDDLSIYLSDISDKDKREIHKIVDANYLMKDRIRYLYQKLNRVPVTPSKKVSSGTVSVSPAAVSTVSPTVSATTSATTPVGANTNLFTKRN